MRTASSAAPTAAGTAAAVNMNGRAAIFRYSITSAGPGDEAPAGGEALGEGPHPQVDSVPDPEQLAHAGAVLAEHADRVGLVDHESGAVTLR